MRVAFLPAITVPSLLGDSAFKEMFQQACEMADMGHECFMICTLEGIKRKKLPLHRGVHYVPILGTGPFYGTQRDMTRIRDLIHPREGVLHVHVVVTSLTYGVHALQGMFFECQRRIDRPKIVIDELYAFGPGSETSGHLFKREEFKLTLYEARALSYPCADLIFWDTWLEEKSGFDGCRRVLSGHSLRKVMKNSVVVPVGIDLERCREIRDSTRKHKNFTLFFGGRSNLFLIGWK